MGIFKCDFEFFLSFFKKKKSCCFKTFARGSFLNFFSKFKEVTMKINSYYPNFILKNPVNEYSSYAKISKSDDKQLTFVLGRLNCKVMRIVWAPFVQLMKIIDYLTENTTVFIYNNTIATKRELSFEKIKIGLGIGCYLGLVGSIFYYSGTRKCPCPTSVIKTIIQKPAATAGNTIIKVLDITKNVGICVFTATAIKHVFFSRKPDAAAAE